MQPPRSYPSWLLMKEYISEEDRINLKSEKRPVFMMHILKSDVLDICFDQQLSQIGFFAHFRAIS